MANNKQLPVEEPVVLHPHKQTALQTYSTEEELTHLVGQGEWELILGLEVFQKRSPESQIQLFSEAITQRTVKMRKTYYNLINRGSAQRSAAMSILARIRQLESFRDESLQKFYENDGLRMIAEEAGVKVYFY